MQTCLVVDEFSVVRKTATRILSLAGYTVHSAETLEEAAALMNSVGQIDIVIVSATLKDCAVEEAIRQVRSHPSAQSATVLASLIEANLGLMTRAKRAGAKGFVYRPFDRGNMAEWLTSYAPPKLQSVA